MNDWTDKLSRRYLATLQEYLVSGQEAVLAEAYELGRTAIARGLGVLDMARIHEKAIEHLIRPMLVMEGQDRVLKAKETFLLESLSPFEAAHRGFRDINIKLQDRNRELEVEIGVRKRTEKALRESKEHFRDLFMQARHMEENLRNLSNQILHVQEEERKRISRELHDEVGQAMTAISINIGALGNNGAAGGDRFKQKAAATQALLLETMETVHRFARELRPAMLDELGLLPALRSYLKGFAARTGLRVRFRGNPIAEKLGNDQKTVLFRVVQESLTNVAKHARASQVEVVVSKLKDGVCMEIADNGRSYKESPMNSAKSRQRLGLLGMQERVRLVDGRFMIKPQPGKGTTVHAVIPFHPESATTRLKQNGMALAKKLEPKNFNHA